MDLVGTNHYNTSSFCPPKVTGPEEDVFKDTFWPDTNLELLGNPGNALEFATTA